MKATQLLKTQHDEVKALFDKIESTLEKDGDASALFEEMAQKLVAHDAKAVELVLLNAGTRYRSTGADRDGAAELVLDDDAPVRLSIRTPEQARQRGRRNGDVRLSAVELVAILADQASG